MANQAMENVGALSALEAHLIKACPLGEARYKHIVDGFALGGEVAVMDGSIAGLIALLLVLAVVIVGIWFEDWDQKRRAAEHARLEQRIAEQQAEIRQRFEARFSALSLGAHKARQALLRAPFEAAKKRSQSGQ